MLEMTKVLTWRQRALQSHAPQGELILPLALPQTKPRLLLHHPSKTSLPLQRSSPLPPCSSRSPWWPQCLTLTPQPPQSRKGPALSRASPSLAPRGLWCGAAMSACSSSTPPTTRQCGPPLRIWWETRHCRTSWTTHLLEGKVSTPPVSWYCLSSAVLVCNLCPHHHVSA